MAKDPSQKKVQPEKPASDKAQSSDKTPAAGEENRRDFFGLAALILGGIVSLAPLCFGLVAFVTPIFRKRKLPELYSEQGQGGGKEGYLRVTSLNALAVGGVPQRFPVIDNQIDAWNFTPEQPVGAVYIERVGAQDVRVFNATCPHAGCSVACNGTAYHCPCHNSAFNLDGTKRVSQSGRENPSPRDMDSLAFEVRDGEIWVEFKNFYTGKHEKTPKS